MRYLIRWRLQFELIVLVYFFSFVVFWSLTGKTLRIVYSREVNLEIGGCPLVCWQWSTNIIIIYVSNRGQNTGTSVVDTRPGGGGEGDLETWCSVTSQLSGKKAKTLLLVLVTSEPAFCFFPLIMWYICEGEEAIIYWGYCMTYGVGDIEPPSNFVSYMWLVRM